MTTREKSCDSIISLPIVAKSTLSSTWYCYGWNTNIWQPPNRTIYNTGEKASKIRTMGNKRNRVTVMLTCVGDGSKLKPTVIFKRRTIPKFVNKHAVLIAVWEQGLKDTKGMKTWIEKVWCSRRGGWGKRWSLLVWDAFKANVTESVKTALARRENTKLAVIPSRLTLILQPLNVSLNKPFEGVRKRSRSGWLQTGWLICKQTFSESKFEGFDIWTLYLPRLSCDNLLTRHTKSFYFITIIFVCWVYANVDFTS